MVRGFLEDVARRPRAGRSTRIDGLRSSLHQLFSGSSSVGRRAISPESLKTPRFAFGRQNLPPGLGLTSTTIPSTRSPTLHSASTLHLPPSSHGSERSHRHISLRDIEDAMAGSISRQEQGRVGRHGERSSKMREHMQNKRARKYFVVACVYLVCLLAVLCTYLGIIFTSDEQRREFHIIMILSLLLLFVFFAHAAGRYWVIIATKPDEMPIAQATRAIDGRGFAIPRQPIQVALARDEEATGIASDTIRYPPPAYGLWRESVRVDPNRLFWARNPATEARNGQDPEEVNAPGAPRPPSYISEDGVNYIISPVPRSTAPTADIPLRDFRPRR